MTILSNINYFKELPFYNVSIDKPKIKRLTNINLLAELPFHDQLSIIKTDQAFSGYAMSYKVEIVERKDPIVGSSYIDLPIELRSPRKGLISIKNNDQKCFLWCHVRHINLVEGRMKKN